MLGAAIASLTGPGADPSPTGATGRAGGDREGSVDTSCDTLVILGSETRSGHTLFAKNSDRPATECQPLEVVPARRPPPGATVRCTYLEISDAPETLAVLGSRPWWIWGFEHGVNAAGVAIGNEALHTRETPAETGLLGMDLVRLGLERGRTADAAKRAITDLLERHGQGGSAQHGGRRFYHNSFIIADPHTAWVLETSGQHWVARRVRGRAAISNLATIGDDWDEVAPGIEAYATAQGWWTPAPGRRFDFRAAFENPEPRYRAEARYDASCRFLAAAGRPGVPELLRHLRDHYDGGTIHRPGRKDGDPQGWSICMHPEPATGATAAAMVAELGSVAPVIAWCAQTTPCTSVFLPLAVGGALPAALTEGTGEPDGRSAWWLMKELGDTVTVDPVGRTPAVQRAWHAWERELAAEVAADRAGTSRLVGPRVETMLRRRHALLGELTTLAPAAPGGPER
jgi:secernin